MLTVIRLFFFVLVTPLLVIFLLAFYVTDKHPSVESQWLLSTKDIQRARMILNGQSAPDPTAALNTLRLEEKDLNIAANHLLNQYFDSTAQVHIKDNHFRFDSSIKLPFNSINPYLNLGFTLRQENQHPRISQLTLGPLTLPDAYANTLIELLINRSDLDQYYLLATHQVQNITITRTALTLTYRWTPKTYAAAQQLLTHNANLEALRFYQQQLMKTVAQHDPHWRLSLATLLQALFEASSQRGPPLDPVKENQAIILVTGLYTLQQDISVLFPKNTAPKSVKFIPVFMYQRIDIAQHFISSALLLSVNNAAFSERLGLKKELYDGRKGQGFSFIDLAANRAGIRLAQTATDQDKALVLQKKMAAISSYKAFMPDVRTLPENLSSTVFKQRFQSTDSFSFRQQVLSIDQKIAACSLYAALKRP
jgi:hypothetical protein